MRCLGPPGDLSELLGGVDVYMRTSRPINDCYDINISTGMDLVGVPLIFYDLSTCLPTCLSIHLSIFLSICLG